MSSKNKRLSLVSWIIIALGLTLHLCAPKIASRDLLVLDDTLFIAPLEHLSLADYFLTWLPSANNYAFPLRDLTFFADFSLTKILGFKTFWLVNIAWFALILALVKRIVDTVIPRWPRTKVAIMAICALHPINGEAVQWLTIRKHLMVATFTALAVNLLLDIRAKSRPIPNWALGIVLFLYLAGLGSYPTGVAFFVWVFWFLWFDERIHKKQLLAFTGLAALLAGAYTWWTSHQNSDYSSTFLNINDVFSRGFSITKYTILSLGRGVFQLIWPMRQGFYFNEHSITSYVGLAFLGLITWIFLHARKVCANQIQLTVPQRFRSRTFAILAALLFAPQFLFVIMRDDFIMADRYLFVPLPYILVALALWLKGLTEAWLTHRKGIIIATLFALSYVVQTLRAVKAWESTETVLQQCATTENSDRCNSHLLEHTFNTKSCEGAVPLLFRHRLRVASSAELRRANFGKEVIFFEALCIAFKRTDSTEMRNIGLEHSEIFFQNRPMVSYAKNMLAFEKHAPNEVRERIQTILLTPELRVSDITPALVNLVRGQIAFYCNVVGNEASCHELSQAFEARFHENPHDDSMKKLGFNHATEFWRFNANQKEPKP